MLTQIDVAKLHYGFRSHDDLFLLKAAMILGLIKCKRPSNIVSLYPRAMLHIFRIAFGFPQSKEKNYSDNIVVRLWCISNDIQHYLRCTDRTRLGHVTSSRCNWCLNFLCYGDVRKFFELQITRDTIDAFLPPWTFFHIFKIHNIQ